MVKCLKYRANEQAKGGLVIAVQYFVYTNHDNGLPIRISMENWSNRKKNWVDLISTEIQLKCILHIYVYYTRTCESRLYDSCAYETILSRGRFFFLFFIITINKTPSVSVW